MSVTQLLKQSLGLILVAALLSASALPVRAVDADDLAAWEQWVADGNPEFNCPWVTTRKISRNCVWPSQLQFQLSEQALEFVYHVDVYRDGAIVALPGSSELWPRDVTVQGKPATVIDRGGFPHVVLDDGQQEIKAKLVWQKRPTSVYIPATIALVSLTEAGAERPVVRRNSQMLLTQSKVKSSDTKEDFLRVEVFRKVTDGVPVMLTTRLIVSASGRSREILLGQAQWPNLELVALESDVPARVEDNGDIRVQVTPGEHHINLISRFLNDPAQIKVQATTEYWPQQEFISFEANSDIREVQLSGVPSMDTSQLPMPDQWRQLPTYMLSAEDTLSIATDVRGDQSPLKNQLGIFRELWLNFDGSGLTGVDTVNGRMRQQWRLNASEGVAVGRAEVSNQPVLVTQLDGLDGVEIRSPEVSLRAITQIANHAEFSVTGWRAEFDSLATALHLPPGWRVLHAWGVDDVRNTWVSKWNLWAIFLVMVLVTVTRKLFGNAAAALGGLALVMAYHEPMAPIITLVFLLVATPLLAVLKGALLQVVSWISVIVSVVTVLMLIAFAVTNFRAAVYPGLEQREYVNRSSISNIALPSRELEDEYIVDDVYAESPVAIEEVVVTAQKREEFSVGLVSPLSRPGYESKRLRLNPYGLSENDRVQTGPGAPTWEWNGISWSATGPVSAEAQMQLVYSPPWLTALWRVLSVLALSAFLAVIIRAVVQRADLSMGGARPMPGVAASLALLALVSAGAATLSSAPAVAEDYPPAYLLEELEQRLNKPPQCAPHCVSLTNGLLEVSQNQFELSFEISAAADVAVPIPSPGHGAEISSVHLDEDVVPAMYRFNDQLMMAVTAGQRRVSILGTLSADSATLTFPASVHNLRVQSADWRVDGLIDGRVVSGSLSLEAITEDEGKPGDVLTPNNARPFVVVHRVLTLGVEWQLTTTVARVAPVQGSMSVAVPLLSGEKPLSRNLVFRRGVAQLQFGADQQQISWNSDIALVDTLSLQASDWDDSGAGLVETWEVIPSALWRVDYEGIPPVKASLRGGKYELQWKPWPAEQLQLSFSRPQAVAGATHTVQQATLQYVAGGSSQKSTLELSILSSLGQEYSVQLPADAEVLSVVHDGDVMSAPKSHTVKLLLRPGLQQVSIEFKQNQALSWLSKTPTVLLPGGASNITVQYEYAADRWPLYINGPAIGPSMLYWGVFLVIVLGALVLAYLDRQLQRKLPIGLLGWLLLGIGLSTVNGYGVLLVALFFFALSYRAQWSPQRVGEAGFNMLQIVLALLTLAALLSLVLAIPVGLLSTPQMLISGNDSWGNLLNYFQDRSPEEAFPQVTVMSLHMLVYRAGMLLWSLWLANRLIVWAQWWWRAYSANGLWQVPAKPVKKKSSAQQTPEA